MVFTHQWHALKSMMKILKMNANHFVMKLKVSTALVIILICAIAIHFYAFINLNMNVIDEMQYILGIKYGLNKSAYPSPVYFAIYSIIENETSNLKLIARLLNLVVFIIGAYPVYKISIRYTDNYATFFIVALYLFSPYSWYVNNVMPEILFGTIFYWIIYAATCKKLNLLNCILLAIGLNLLVGVKNHGIFVIPIISIFLFFKYRDKEIEKNKLILFFALLIIIKIIIDYYNYGEVVLFSKVYSTVLNQPITFSYYDLIKKLIIATIGNISYGAAFFLVPIIALIGDKESRSKFSITIFIGYAIFLIMTILFSVKVSDNPSESIFRIHNRYYAFYSPLLFIASFEIINRIKQKRFLLILMGSTFAVLLGYLFNKFYILSYIDNADNNVVFLHPIFLFILPILVVLCKNSINLKNYYYGLIIYIIIASLWVGYGSYKFRTTNTPSDAAGIYICKKYNDKSNKNINIYVDSFTDFGFLYFNCPLNYNVHYFKDLNSSKISDMYFIGNYVYNNPDLFSQLEKISETMYYAK